MILQVYRLLVSASVLQQVKPFKTASDFTKNDAILSEKQNWNSS